MASRYLYDVSRLQSIKEEQLHTIFSALKHYKFKSLIPLSLNDLKYIYTNDYLRTIGVKGGRNSGLAFAFIDKSNKLFGVFLKRHPAPHYTQFIYDSILPLSLPLDVTNLYEDDASKKILQILNIMDNSYTISNSNLESLLSLWAFDMLELEYYKNAYEHSKIYFVTKNTLLSAKYTDRMFLCFTESSVEGFDCKEHVLDRHYDYVKTVFVYDIGVNEFESVYLDFLNYISTKIEKQI